MSDTPPPGSPPRPNFLDTLRQSKWLTDVAQIFATVVAAIGTFQTTFKDKPYLAAAAAGVIVLLSGWWWLARRRGRKVRAPQRPIAVPIGAKAYLRGPLPFEGGETLLGRDQDLGSVIAIVDREEFRFGYISGEAGAGKTSFLRAALIPKLKAAQWVVVHVPRLGSDPLDAFRKALRGHLATATPPFTSAESAPTPASAVPPPPGANASLAELARALPRPAGRRLILVCDQFEQFFLTFRTVESRQPFLAELAACLNDETLALSLVLGLRKEFVDDLQDLEAHIPALVDRRNRHRLRTWDAAAATDVLRAAAGHDQAPFAPELLERIAADLAQQGIVRPVELMMVATRLHEQRIYDLARYDALGGARGVLTSYLREYIAPDGEKTPELQREAARHLLRALCDGGRDTRRPTGLTEPELVAEVRESIRHASLAALATDTAALETTVRTLIKSGLEQFILIHEDEDRLNLTHDYLVGPVRDATTDVRSLEEQADRLLDQFLEYARQPNAPSLTLRQVRFIRRHAPRLRLADAAVVELLRKFRRSFARDGIILGVLMLVSLAFVLPSGPAVSATEVGFPGMRWIVSADGETFVAHRTDQESYLWRLSPTLKSMRALPLPFVYVALSPKGTYIAGITKDGDLHLFRSDTLPTKAGTPAMTSLSVGDPVAAQVTFSKDERWMAVSTADGKCYLWNPPETPPEKPVPILALPGIHTAPSNPKNPRKEIAEITFSPDTEWLLVHWYLLKPNGDIGARLAHLFSLTSSPAREVLRLDNLAEPAWSPGGRWFAGNIDTGLSAVPGSPGLVARNFQRAVWDLQSLKRSPNETKMVKVFSPLPYYVGVHFSPDDRWLASNEPTVGTFLVNLAQPSTAQGTHDSLEWFPRRIGYYRFLETAFTRREIFFSSDAKYIGANDSAGNIYVWPTAEKLDRRATPFLAGTDTADTSFAFSPSGRFVVASDSSGRVYSQENTNLQGQNKFHGSHGAAPLAFRFSNDERYLLTYGGFDVYFGEFEGELKHVHRSIAPVAKLRVAPGRRQLVVFGRDRVAFVERYYRLWGLPLWPLEWPELAPDKDN